MVKIAPSILSADFTNLERELKKIEPVADMIHVDVMDGNFVPNITVGPMIVGALKRITKLPLDVHLMIAEPDKYLEIFAKEGSDIITVHQEVCNHLNRTIAEIKKLGKKAGVALNPATPVEFLDPIVNDIDLVLIMSVNPGFGGQEFIPSSIEKIKKMRRLIDTNGSTCEIAVDGGIKVENSAIVAQAGANILVAGSEIFHSNDPLKTAQLLKEKGNNNNETN